MTITKQNLPEQVQKIGRKRRQKWYREFKKSLAETKDEDAAMKAAFAAIGIDEDEGEDEMAAKAMSFEDHIDQVRAALQKQYGSIAHYVWPAQTFDDSVVAELQPNVYFQIPYTIADGEIEFGGRDEWLKVQRETQWVEAKAAYLEKAGRRHSRRDDQMLQDIHDKAVGLGASCEAEPPAKAQPPETNALKAVAETEDELRVANYIILYNGRDLEGVASPRKNADGSKGEYFTPETQLESEFTKAGQLPIDWEHGRLAKEDGLGKDDILGFVDWATAKADEFGVWVERVLDRRNRYVKFVEKLIKDGLIGTSSEADPAAVQKAADGQILAWPLVRDSLTVNPMDPRMLGENHLEALKALNFQIENDRKINIARLRLKAKRAQLLEV